MSGSYVLAGPNHVYRYQGPFPESSEPKYSSEGIPAVLHVVWVGGTPPEMVDRRVQSWRDVLGPGWFVRLWTDANVTEEFFAPEVLQRIRSAGNGAQKADLVKYHVIRDRGGFYVDADCDPVRSLEPLRSAFAEFGALGCHERDYDPTFPYLSCAFFGARAGHAWLEEACRDVMTTALNTPDQHLTTGPACLGRALARAEAQSPVLILPTSYVYPTGDKNSDASLWRGAEVFMVHQWLHSWATEEPPSSGFVTTAPDLAQIAAGLYRYTGPFPTARKPSSPRIPLTLHLIWVGGDVPDFAHAAVAKWRELLDSRWSIRLWTDADLDSFAPDVRLKMGQAPNGAQKADILKYHVIRNHGGFYVDADCLPIRSLDPLLDQFESATALACHEEDAIDPLLPSVSCGFFGAAREHPWMTAACQLVMGANLTSKDQHLTTGPSCLGRAAFAVSDSDPIVLLPKQYAYPTYERNADAAAFREPERQVLMYHQWFGSWVESRQAQVETPPRTRLQDWHAPQWIQRTTVHPHLIGRSRRSIFEDLCRGKTVFHVGYTDFPYTDLSCNLHLDIAPVCAQLDGLDIHVMPEAQLTDFRSRLNGKGELFTGFEELRDRAYDLVLVPEVLEHVADMALFLKQLSSVRAREYILTVPDAHQCFHRHFDRIARTNEVAEAINADHNCWFSPYTFKNVVHKFTPWRIAGLWTFNEISLLMRAYPTS